MKTDSLFYLLFQALPEAFFELLNQPTSLASAYSFASVEGVSEKRCGGGGSS